MVDDSTSKYKKKFSNWHISEIQNSIILHIRKNGHLV